MGLSYIKWVEHGDVPVIHQNSLIIAHKTAPSYYIKGVTLYIRMTHKVMGLCIIIRKTNKR